MKKIHFKLALTVATSAVVMLSGLTVANAGELNLARELTLAKQQPLEISGLNTETDGMYIVRLKDAPVATYEGGVKGLATELPDAHTIRALESATCEEEGRDGMPAAALWIVSLVRPA